MDQSKNHFQSQKGNTHRYGTEHYFKEKAEEHALLMSPADREGSCIDIGCGAGELLYYLSSLINIQVGLDYSDSMLVTARHRLSGKNILLINKDTLDYLRTTDSKVWMSCAGTNQYEDATYQKKLLDIFMNNLSAKSLCLFECIDPIRFSMINLGISYLPGSHVSNTKSVISHFYHIIRCFCKLFGWALKPSTESFYLGSPSMGFGYFPRFWLKECESRNFDIQIVSSRFYEYRYHVLIHKRK